MEEDDPQAIAAFQQRMFRFDGFNESAFSSLRGNVLASGSSTAGGRSDGARQFRGVSSGSAFDDYGRDLAQMGMQGVASTPQALPQAFQGFRGPQQAMFQPMPQQQAMPHQQAMPQQQVMHMPPQVAAAPLQAKATHEPAPSTPVCAPSSQVQSPHTLSLKEWFLKRKEVMKELAPAIADLHEVNKTLGGLISSVGEDESGAAALKSLMKTSTDALQSSKGIADSADAVMAKLESAIPEHWQLVEGEAAQALKSVQKAAADQEACRGELQRAIEDEKALSIKEKTKERNRFNTTQRDLRTGGFGKQTSAHVSKVIIAQDKADAPPSVVAIAAGGAVVLDPEVHLFTL